MIAGFRCGSDGFYVNLSLDCFHKIGQRTPNRAGEFAVLKHRVLALVDEFAPKRNVNLRVFLVESIFGNSPSD